MKRRWLWTLTTLFLLSAGSASAANVEKRAALAARTRISVEPGIGHTIDFSETSEKVYRAWVGDGGQCLQVLGGSPLEEGTQIVNLRRFVCQEGGGFQPVAETVVTLTTQDTAGEISVYEFIVRYSDTGSSLTRIVDNPLPESIAESQEGSSVALSINAVRAGLASFNLEAESPIAMKVDQWTQAVESGNGQRQAAQTVAIDWEILERLNQLGLRSALSGSSAL